MVDVVGAKSGAHQFLHQIGFFVRPLGGAEPGEALGAVFGANPADSVGGPIERFFPGRFAEMRERVGRVDVLMGILADTVLADQRHGQPMGVMHVVEAKAALYAKSVAIRRAFLAVDEEQLAVF